MTPTTLNRHTLLNTIIPVVFSPATPTDAQLLRDTNQYISIVPEKRIPLRPWPPHCTLGTIEKDLLKTVLLPTYRRFHSLAITAHHSIMTNGKHEYYNGGEPTQSSQAAWEHHQTIWYH